MTFSPMQPGVLPDFGGTRYGDKEVAGELIKKDVQRNLEKLHPEDRVDVARRLSRWADKVADEQVKINEEKGVPDR